MTEENFNQQRKDITDSELIDLCKQELSSLCKTGGRSFKMCVPVNIMDTDILFSELIIRFKKLTDNNG